MSGEFQSTPPVWGATHYYRELAKYMTFQSTPPVWGATGGQRHRLGTVPISIHAPRVGGDTSRPPTHRSAWKFQSTPPVWGATHWGCLLRPATPHFNPRPPCGGRRLMDYPEGPAEEHFNPRPPCGGRRSLESQNRACPLFQSTPPVWGATRGHVDDVVLLHISIHAPRVGGDHFPTANAYKSKDFNPRPPCGGRHTRPGLVLGAPGFQSTPPVWGATPQMTQRAADELFQSTPPVWGATRIRPLEVAWMTISIHAPRVGGDDGQKENGDGTSNFNPRPPCGGRHGGAEDRHTAGGISIHAPRVGGDARAFCQPGDVKISIHAPRVGGDNLHPGGGGVQSISIHAPRVGGDLIAAYYNISLDISIHAPRVGGDRSSDAIAPDKLHFNPRPPCGGRPINEP